SDRIPPVIPPALHRHGAREQGGTIPMNSKALLHGWTMTDTLRWGSMATIALAIFIGTFQIVSDQSGLPYRYWNRYVSSLERKLRGMFIFTPGRLIGIGQLATMFVIIAANLTFDLPMWWLFIVSAAILPTIYIESLRRQRVLKIEDQLDNFILALANALK